MSSFDLIDAASEKEEGMEDLGRTTSKGNELPPAERREIIERALQEVYDKEPLAEEMQEIVTEATGMLDEVELVMRLPRR
eukprot:768391-Hanusia_phi.AAC.5